MKNQKLIFTIIALLIIVVPIQVNAQPNFSIVCDAVGQLNVGSTFSCQVNVAMGSTDTLSVVELRFTPHASVSLDNKAAGMNWTLSNTEGNSFTFKRDNQYISDSGTVATFSFTTLQTPGEVRINVTGVRYEVCETADCEEITPEIPPLESIPEDKSPVNPPTGIVNPFMSLILGITASGIIFYIVKKQDIFHKI